jgi:hypothetical protein
MPVDPVLVQLLGRPMSEFRAPITVGADWGPWPISDWKLDGVAYAPTGIVSATLRILDPTTGAALTTGTATVTNFSDDPAEGLDRLTLSMTAAQTAAIAATCGQAIIEARVIGDDARSHLLMYAAAPILPSEALPE